MLSIWIALPTELWASDLAQLHQPHALLNSQLAERAVVGRQAQRQRQEAEQAAARQAALERQGAPDEDATPRRYEELVPPPADQASSSPSEARARAGLTLAAPVQAPPVQTLPVQQPVVEHTTDQPVAPTSPLLKENPMERAVRNAIRDAAHRTLVNGSSAHPMAWIPPPRGFEAGVTAGFNAGFAEAKRQAMAHRIASPTSQQCASRDPTPVLAPCALCTSNHGFAPHAGK